MNPAKTLFGVNFVSETPMFFRWNHQDAPNSPSLLRCHQKTLKENDCSENSDSSSFPLISPAMMGSLISDRGEEKRISGNLDSIHTDSCLLPMLLI